MVDLLGRNDNLAAPKEENPMFRILVSLALVLLAPPAFGQTPLRVKMFPGAQALPVMAAASPGIFERHGLKVEVLFTENSPEQSDGHDADGLQIRATAEGNVM